MQPQFQPDFAKAGGLITAIAVDDPTGEVLMVAYMNEESFGLTLETGRVHYWSRSRQKLWKKGESSGNMQELVEVRVGQSGPAGHEGFHSCFYRTVAEDGSLVEISEREMTPEEMYGSTR